MGMVMWVVIVLVVVARTISMIVRMVMRVAVIQVRDDRAHAGTTAGAAHVRSPFAQ